MIYMYIYMYIQARNSVYADQQLLRDTDILGTCLPFADTRVHVVARIEEKKSGSSEAKSIRRYASVPTNVFSLAGTKVNVQLPVIPGERQGSRQLMGTQLEGRSII